MADKTIPELPLISSVTDSVQIPGDDSLQTYRLTAAQLKAYVLSAQAVLLANLKNDIFTGLTDVTPADDDYFPLVDTSDSNLTKKGLVGSFRRAIYRSVTTTDSVGVGDETMKLSGASFTSTLPTAVGVSGKRYKFLHAGTHLTQVYTLATTSGQTIGGIASGQYSLYTNGECLEIESDGANWIIINHFTETEFVDAGVLTIGAVTTGPTKGTTTTDKVYWKRSGRFAYLKYRYVQTGAGSAGSGDYLISFPSGLTPDTTHTNTYTGTDAQTKMTTFLDADLGVALPTSNLGVMRAILYNTTQFRVHGILNAASSIDFSSGAFPLSSSSLRFYGWVKIPVAGWQP